MSRSSLYVRSLASGYVTLAANTAFTLASVPLALHYLSENEFGLWALSTQLAGYIALVDFGMSAAVAFWLSCNTRMYAAIAQRSATGTCAA